MNLPNAPISESKATLRAIFQTLLDRSDLRPSAWNRSFTHLIGLAIWDIFSNNHEVISLQREVYDIGSFRGSGSTISEVINEHFAEEQSYDYLDFYMGSDWIAEGIEMQPLYEAIFALLRERNCDWYYSFPRIHLMDMKSKSAEQDNLQYDPTQAMKDELAEQQRQRELDEMRVKLDALHEESLAEAKRKPLPPIILAYQKVYGKMPTGSPF